MCDKVNKWAGWTNWGTKSHRNKDGDLLQGRDIKPIATFSPRNNIWKYSVGAGYSSKDKVAHKHPAIYPLNLAIDNIFQWSKVGDTVLDPFIGSGTTAIASYLTGRNCIGIDVNPNYLEIAMERLSIYSSSNNITIEEWEKECVENKKRQEVMDFVKTAKSLGYTKEEVMGFVEEGFSYTQKK